MHMKYSVYTSSHTIDIDSNSIENMDIVKISSEKYHFIENGTCHECKVISVNTNDKKVTLELDGEIYELNILSPIDNLIKDMGMNVIKDNSQKEVLAPMPGLILEVLIEIGQEVKKDDSLVILEAMKMENILKAEGEGIVKEIRIEKGDTVDKRQVLIELE